MRALLLTFFLSMTLGITACGPIPVQMQSSKQEQRQSVKQEVANDLAADQQSSHQSESKQGTNSMPVIIICNMNSAAGANCITPKADGALQKNLDSHLKGNAK